MKAMQGRRWGSWARSTGVCALALGLAGSAWAWTNRPVRFIVPAPAGGTMDIVARLLADQVGADIGQPVIVDNKPGAGGAIAVAALKSSPADGQTLLVTASNVLTEIPLVMKTNFDPLVDLKPVAAVASATMVLVGAPNLPAHNVKELVTYLRANKGSMSFASYSAGTSSHFAGIILSEKAALDLQHVPFPGSPPALAQVMGNQIPLMFDGMATSLPLIKASKVKVFAVASTQRSMHLPNVPTMAEEGYPDIVASNWVGVVAASAMSREMVDKISEEIARASSAPRVKDRLVSAGFEPAAPLTPAKLADAVRADYQRNAAIVQRYRINLNP